jgi:hypothetical protein
MELCHSVKLTVAHIVNSLPSMKPAAARMKMKTFWDVAACSLLDISHVLLPSSERRALDPRRQPSSFTTGSQEPATHPYTGQHQPTPHPPALFPSSTFSILASMPMASERSNPFWLSNIFSPSPCVLHAPPISSSLFHHPNIVWWKWRHVASNNTIFSSLMSRHFF